MRTLAAALIVTLALPVSASAREKDPDFWATVNICDTQLHPDAMGVRASIPGDGTKKRMYMRFNATFYSVARKAWYPVKGNGRSPWIYVGTAKVRARRGGWTFEFAPPEPGTEFVVRGVVEYQWRKRRKPKKGRAAREVTVRRAQATTLHGVKNVGPADPPGTSEGLCVIKP